MSSSEQAKKIQEIQQKILLLDEYLRAYKQRMIEINVALDTLEQARDRGQQEAYQLLGANVMIKRSIEEVIKDLKEERDIIAERIKALEKELSSLKTTLETLLPKQQLGQGG